jgi:hypothetical protein
MRQNARFAACGIGGIGWHVSKVLDASAYRGGPTEKPPLAPVQIVGSSAPVPLTTALTKFI